MQHATTARTTHPESTRRLREDVRAWLSRSERLIGAFRRSGETEPTIRRHVEALRHKNDTLATKLAALEQHVRRNVPGGLDEVREARHDLREAWLTTIRALDRTASAAIHEND